MALLFLSATFLKAANVQLVSALDSMNEVPASANGDSSMPFITPDGRYILFASTANNLVMTNDDGPVIKGPPNWINVYLRDQLMGTTTLVSVNMAGTGGNANSYPTGLSANGQFALFESTATGLVTNTINAANNIYVRDMINNVTMLVSVNTNSDYTLGSSFHSVMTPDGQYVAFTSSSDLTPDDTNELGFIRGDDVFVRDLWTGTTTLASVGGLSTNLTPLSDYPAITPDGHYVAFDTYYFNSQNFSTTPMDVYVRDMVGETTYWASTNARSIFNSIYGTTNVLSISQTISADGQYVAFETASNTAGSTVGIVLRDNIQTGVIDLVSSNALAATIYPLGMSSDGRFITYLANASGGYNYSVVDVWDADMAINTPVSVDRISGLPVAGVCAAPAINSTGQYVTFLCNGSNLTTNTVTGYNLYFRDMLAGATYLVNVDTDGIGDGVDDSCSFGMSDDGGTVAFDSPNSSLVPGDFNRNYDVFAGNPTTDAITLISVCNPTSPSQSPNGYSEIYPTCISTNDRYVAFTSSANNLTSNDTNGFYNVYVSDLLLDTNTLVSVGTNGFGANDYCTQPSISGSGQFVAFAGYAVNLIAGESSHIEQIFRRDLLAATNALVSVSTNGGFGNNNSFSPAISSDGRYVMFYSQAQNLARNLAAGLVLPPTNLFFRDILASTNYPVTTGMVMNASMTPDGHYVAFVGVTKINFTNLYVWNSQTKLLVYTNTAAALTNVAISADGRWVAYVTSSSLKAYDLIGQTNYSIATATIDSQGGLQFGGNDRYLVFATKSKLVAADNNGTYDVYYHDFQLGTNILVSVSYNSTNAANGPSWLPAISPGGGLIAYRSTANNIVPNDTNGAEDVFVYDVTNATTMLMSVNQAGASTANSFSTVPVLSNDGDILVFESYATDLYGNGFNEFSSVYAFDLTNFPVANGLSGGSGESGGGNSGISMQLIVPGGSSLPQLMWPLSPGQNYQVQYEDDLTGTNWQSLNGGTVFVGGMAEVQDLAPSPTNRFYRLVLP
jgi:hypothetical protein